jgi:transcription elongation factor GreA
MDELHLSPQAHERLQAELEHRSGPHRLDISDKIERARELGDLKENADYHAAKDEQGLNEARIRQIEAMLKKAVIVEGNDSDVVAPGTIVEIRMEGDDEPSRYLVGSIEERSDTHDVLSVSSPLGQALLGKGPGEVAKYATPKGKELAVEVVSISPAD